MTMLEDDISGVSYASSEPRGYTRTLLLVAALSASLTANVIQLWYAMGVHL